MPDYKFYYFEVRGVGEPARMAFHYGGIPFEDIRVPQQEWPDLKKKMPQGTVPCLFIDNGKIKLSQSSAIALYIGRKVGLAGRTELEMARVEEAIATYKDLYTKMADYCYTMTGFKDMDKDELYEKQAKPVSAQYFTLLSKMLKKHHNTFVASQKPTVADFFFAEYLSSVNGFAPELFKGHEGLLDYVKRVHSIPQLQDYLKKRPKTAW
ncbi:unnamed protein product [Bursaphelenchus xylophilus]|uniref:glutathione transferase n=1 Tax=Bursaphelenchus xylophilus TaxID=6326 RepID=A0A1I7RM95_BURXY|nr:unnamed protein product [Bursaphelenchus xylophilus]CAG9118318.1 unnamed protein product [Bursaphelenchus xylophilus]